jgi:hypothetical protein
MRDDASTGSIVHFEYELNGPRRQQLAGVMRTAAGRLEASFRS